MKKYISLVIIFLGFFPFVIKGETLQDKYDQLANLQAQYNTNKNNKALTEEQIKSLNNEISSITTQIATIREEIEKAEKDIEDSKQKIDDKKIETDGLIQFLQVSNGGNIYLEYLFDAENYTDFIYRYEVVKQLTNYNSDLISELEQLIIDLNKKEEDLKRKNITLEEKRKTLTSKVNTLTASLKNYRTEGTTLEEDISNLKQEIKAYENAGCKRNSELSSCTSSIYAFGWKYPLTWGCVTSEYTGYNLRTDWSGGGGHHGIDLDCVGEGTKVYPAAAGTVAAVVYRSSCGGNMVYIYHTVNGKKYTTVYMHMLSIESGITKGKVVTDTTVIGYVGGGSTASYDRCTAGAHLHFGMAEGWNSASFNSYSFNPRELFKFPSLVYSGGGYFSR